MIKQWIKKKIYKSPWFLRILNDKSLFEYFQSKGIHVIDNHFYNPVPDTSTLDKNLFSDSKNLSALDLNEAEQISHFNYFSTFKPEYSKFSFEKTNVDYEYYWNNGGFMCMDAVALYGMIRHYKPKLMIEVGGGNSSKLSATAINENENEGNGCELICIEPFPNQILKNGFKGLKKVMETEVQKISISKFQNLQAGDILFIDSSHVLKAGSDVEYYFDQVLPQLNAGVIIHFHDIFLPEEYPEDWIMKEHRFWNEQYILQSFLSFNSSFKILFAGRYFQLMNDEKIKSALDFYPAAITKAGSFWIQKVK